MQTRNFCYNLLRITKEIPCVCGQQIFINIPLFTFIQTLLSLKYYAPETRSSVKMTWRYCACICKPLMFRCSRSVQMLHNVTNNNIDLLEVHVHVSSFQIYVYLQLQIGERGGSVVECRTPEREVRGSRPNAAVLCPWARHFTPRKYWLITQEAMAPSRHDWKIVDWDVKPQHNQQPTAADQSEMYRRASTDSITIHACTVGTPNYWKERQVTLIKKVLIIWKILLS